MKKEFSPLYNKKGQFLIETVLLMALSLGLFVAGTKYLREKKIIENAVQGPWSRVSTMVEAGVWAPKSATALARHPNMAQHRGVTLQEFQ